MKKNWGIGLSIVAITSTLLTALVVFHAVSASGQCNCGGSSSTPVMNSPVSQPFVVVLEPGFPIHLQDPQYVADRFFGNIMRPDELANIMRQNWIEAFINKGSTNDDRHQREYLIERQLGYEDGQSDAAMGIVIVNMNAYTWEGIDFAMDWGTGIAQDVTGQPYNEAYDGPKWLTSVAIVAVDEWTDIDLDAKNEYREQAVDQTIEVFSDFAIGHALDNIKTVKCNAPETLAEMGSTGVKGIRYMLDRAAERSDRKPSLGWEPPLAR
jgi:hypothetical protein